jgi:hypothetical protein
MLSRLTFTFVSPLIARASAQTVLGAADLQPLVHADHNASLRIPWATLFPALYLVSLADGPRSIEMCILVR